MLTQPKMTQTTTNDRLRAALFMLQWVLGLVILEQSLRFAFSPSAARTFAQTGLPDFIHQALAWAEIAAAVLFLVPRAIVPRASVAGGWLLLIVLASAIIIHLLHGWFDVGALVVYMAAAWVAVAANAAPVS